MDAVYMMICGWGGQFPLYHKAYKQVFCLKWRSKLSCYYNWMVQQSENYTCITIGLTIVGSMCMCDAPIVEEWGYLA